jgi:restriction system protein
MSRKRKTSPIEDVIDVIAMLPWWAGVAIAVVGYLVLHRLATPAVISAVQPGQMGNLVAQSMVAAFAYAGQYLVPLVGLIGAAISFFRRKQRVALVADVAQARSADALDGMSWREFELLVGEAFRLQSYRVTETGGGGPDGGIDLVLTKGTEKFLVQCKQWKAYKVSVDVVRELYGVMAAKGAAGGFVVTSGRFTDDARKFAAGRNVHLVDGPKLFAMIKQAKQSLATTAQPIKSKPQMATPRAVAATSCPLCGSGIVKRTARNGSNAGNEFWGCSTFPKCRGVRPLA